MGPARRVTLSLAVSALGGTAEGAPLSSQGPGGLGAELPRQSPPTACGAAPCPRPLSAPVCSSRPFLAPETDWMGRRRGWSPAPPQSGPETSRGGCASPDPGPCLPRSAGSRALPHRQARPAARRPHRPSVLPTTRPSRLTPSVTARPPLPVVWSRASGQSPGSGGPHGGSRAELRPHRPCEPPHMGLHATSWG